MNRWLWWAVVVAGAGVSAGAVLAAAVLVAVWHINSADYRQVVAAAVERSTGFVVSIDGGVQFGVMPRPTIVATQVRVSNPPWSERAEMARIDRVEVGFSPVDLLLRRNRLARLIVTGGDLHLETDGHGRANWWLEANADPNAVYPPLDIGHLEVVRSRIGYVDDASHGTVRLGIERMLAALPLNRPMTVSVRGDYFGTPFTASVTGGRFDDLMKDRPYWPVTWHLETVGTTVDAGGFIDRPISRRIFDFQLSVAGRSFDRLSPALGLPLPPIDQFGGKTHLTGGWPRYRLTDLVGHFGVSDVAGQVMIESGGPRPRLDGRLQSRVLYRRDLVGSRVETPPPSAPDDGHLFNANPLPLSNLLALDGRVDLTVHRFVTWPVDFFDLDTTIDLVAGRLALRPLRATVAGGRIDLVVSADAGRTPATLHVSGRGDALASEQIFPALGMTSAPTGPFSIDLDLAGVGPSLRSFLTGANGRARLAIGPGTLPVRHLDLIASDLLAALMPWTTRTGDRTELNCMVTRLKIRNGLAEVLRLLIDTGKITVTGAGELDFGSERLDLRLDPRPKDPALISLATAMRVTGTLADHSAAPDAVGLAKGAATGLVLAIGELNPLAFMLPFLSVGTGIANPCPAELAGRTVAAAPPFIVAPWEGLGGLLDGVGHAITHGVAR